MAAKDPGRRREVAQMGGRARKDSLSQQQRTRIAQTAASARWAYATVPPAGEQQVAIESVQPDGDSGEQG